MTTYSPVYGMPSPELLVGSADAAAAFTAVGSRIDREMTQLRSSTSLYLDLAPVSIGPNQAAWMYQTDISISVIGWVEVEVAVQMGSTGGGANCAGFVKHQFAGGITRELRYHNHGRGTWWDVGGTATYTAMSGQTTVPYGVSLYCDPGSAVGVEAFTLNLAIRQYGAPGSG